MYVHILHNLYQAPRQYIAIAVIAIIAIIIIIIANKLQYIIIIANKLQ